MWGYVYKFTNKNNEAVLPDNCDTSIVQGVRNYRTLPGTVRDEGGRKSQTLVFLTFFFKRCSVDFITYV